MDWKEFLDRLEDVREVQIETAPAPDAPSRRTTVWPAPQDGRLYVRSLRGQAGRWFRDLLAHPEAVLHADDEAVPVVAEVAADPESVAAASAALRRRYAGSSALDAMTREEILDTTVRLSPR